MKIKSILKKLKFILANNEIKIIKFFRQLIVWKLNKLQLKGLAINSAYEILKTCPEITLCAKKNGYLYELWVLGGIEIYLTKINNQVGCRVAEWHIREYMFKMADYKEELKDLRFKFFKGGRLANLDKCSYFNDFYIGDNNEK